MMFGRIKLWLAAAGAFVFAVAVAFFRGRYEGKQRAEAKRVKERLGAMKKAKEIRDEVDHSDDDTLVDGIVRKRR